MIVKSDKFNIYIEGIKIPNSKFRVEYSRNALSRAIIEIPIGAIIEPTMWANAFIQVTYLDEKKEKRFFDGLCFELELQEDLGIMSLVANSIWDTFSLNSTLDYMSPKKYGLQNLEEGDSIWIGNEEQVSVSISELSEGNDLSSRYFFLGDIESEDITLDDPNANKLQFIINRIPFAERFAFSFFEDIAYNNFFLTKSYAERFNLLAKTKSQSRILAQNSAESFTFQQSLEYDVGLDSSRTGLYWDESRGEKIVNYVEDPVSNVTTNTAPSSGEAPACRQALNDANAKWPNRNKASDGIMGDAAHQARKSDHNQGNAVDITHDPRSGCSGDLISSIAINDPRMKYVIWNRRIYFKKSGWIPYNGSNPHTQHCHISINTESRNDTTKWGWNL